MSSRRSFLGAAGAVLALPTTGREDTDPDASTQGYEEVGPVSPPASTRPAARVTASADVSHGDGSVSVRSIRFRRPGEKDEAELVLAVPPLRFGFTLDTDATRQLRDTLRGDRREGDVGGSARLFTDVGGEEVEASVAVRRARLQVSTADVEAAVVLDEEVRADLLAGLDDALAEPAVVEE